jgi:hypothetical protein
VEGRSRLGQEHAGDGPDTLLALFAIPSLVEIQIRA